MSKIKISKIKISKIKTTQFSLVTNIENESSEQEQSSTPSPSPSTTTPHPHLILWTVLFSTFSTFDILLFDQIWVNPSVDPARSFCYPV